MGTFVDIRSQLVRGIAAAKAGDKAEARRYLERVVLDSAATHDQKAQAYLWLTGLTDDPAEKREYLEHALALDPTNAGARRGLAILDGRLKTEDIIDPDRQPAPKQPETPQPVTARRFVCPQCGGVMQFEPGGKMIHCAHCGHCGHRQTIFTALKDGLAVEEHDFAVALATAEGHALPAGMHTLHCQGCQAKLLLTGELTAQCPYCGSSHIAEIEAQEMVQPEGIIPFAVTADEATKTFRRWLDKNIHSDQIRTTRVRGLYLPAWTFDISGEVRWRGTEPSDNRSSGSGFGLKVSGSGIGIGATGGYGGSQKRIHEGSHYVLEDDILIPATHTLPQNLIEVFHKFLLKEAVPYDSAFLADWPAEIYTISPSDASLSARQIALKKGEKAARMQATIRVPNIQNVQTFPSNMAALSYKLLLLPLWIANYRLEGTVYTVAVNGQTNKVSGQKPAGFFKKLFGDILG